LNVLLNEIAAIILVPL